MPHIHHFLSHAQNKYSFMFKLSSLGRFSIFLFSESFILLFCLTVNTGHYLKINTASDVRNEPMEIHRETDLRLFSLMVDCPARTLLGSTYTTSF